MAEPEEYTVKDMVDTAIKGEPGKFADYFSGVMVDRVNDRVDQIRQAVAAKLGGEDPTDTPAMELGPEEQGDEAETEHEDEEHSDAEETEGTDRED